MRNITTELKLRLDMVREERVTLQARLRILDDIEHALELLMAQERVRHHGQQLSVVPTNGVNGKHAIGQTPLSKFLVEVMSDGAAHPLKVLADLGTSNGLDFQGKNPLRVLHFVLIGLKRNGYTEMVAPSVWRLTDKGMPRISQKSEPPAPEQGSVNSK